MTALPCLLVHEASPSLSVFLEDQLEGWTVRGIGDIANLASYLPAAALLLAGTGDRTSIARQARRLGLIGPLFSLVDQDEEVTTPLLPLVKPLRLNQLAAKLANSTGAAVDGAWIGAWMIDATQRALIRPDIEAVERLTDKEFAVLAGLLTHAPDAVTREQLQEEIWGYHAEAATHTVETHIWRLRQKIETDPAHPVLLLTEADGYRLNLQARTT